MELEILINEDIKQAMISKDKEKLEALRAIKAALLLEKTGKDVSSGIIPETVELKLLQRLVKQSCCMCFLLLMLTFYIYISLLDIIIFT